MKFDFAKAENFDSALEGVQTVFLMRPLELADIELYFLPLVKALEKNRVRQVLFCRFKEQIKSN